jgi:hypothetical protein
MNSVPSPVKSSGRGRLGAGLEAHLDRPRLGGVAAQEALLLQGREVGVDGAARRQADGLADLSDTGRIAPFADLEVDELENLALTLRELGHGIDRSTNGCSGQTPVRDFP